MIAAGGLISDRAARALKSIADSASWQQPVFLGPGFDGAGQMAENRLDSGQGV